MAGDAVARVRAGEHARAVGVAGARDALVRPTRVAQDREVGRAVSGYGRAGLVLEDRPRALEVGVELARCQPVDELVGEAVRADFVTGRGDLRYQTRQLFGHPPQNEEGPARTGVSACLEHGSHRTLDPQFMPGPALHQRVLGVEVVLDVHREHVLAMGPIHAFAKTSMPETP